MNIRQILAVAFAGGAVGKGGDHLHFAGLGVYGLHAAGKLHHCGDLLGRGVPGNLRGRHFKYLDLPVVYVLPAESEPAFLLNGVAVLVLDHGGKGQAALGLETAGLRGGDVYGAGLVSVGIRQLDHIGSGAAQLQGQTKHLRRREGDLLVCHVGFHVFHGAGGNQIDRQLIGVGELVGGGLSCHQDLAGIVHAGFVLIGFQRHTRIRPLVFQRLSVLVTELPVQLGGLIGPKLVLLVDGHDLPGIVELGGNTGLIGVLRFGGHVHFHVGGAHIQIFEPLLVHVVIHDPHVPVLGVIAGIHQLTESGVRHSDVRTVGGKHLVIVAPLAVVAAAGAEILNGSHRVSHLIGEGAGLVVALALLLVADIGGGTQAEAVLYQVGNIVFCHLKVQDARFDLVAALSHVIAAFYGELIAQIVAVGGFVLDRHVFALLVVGLGFVPGGSGKLTAYGIIQRHGRSFALFAVAVGHAAVG